MKHATGAAALIVGLCLGAAPAGFASSDDGAEAVQADSLEAGREAREAAEDSAEKAREAADEAQEAARRACGHRDEDDHHSGGAVGVQMLWLDTRPLKDLAAAERSLRGKKFDFEDNIVPMVGFMCHHEGPSGLRGGGSVWAGYRRFDARYPVDDDTTTHDSVTVLKVIPIYGGFNFEKVFRFYRFGVSVGGMMGAGADIVYKRAYDLQETQYFVSSVDDTVEVGDWAWAPYIAWEARAGFTMVMAPVFQIGVDGFVLFTYAPEGFGIATGDFFSVSPGVRVKFAFGRVPGE